MMTQWLQELQTQYGSGAAHTFLLHLNVGDDVLMENGNIAGLQNVLMENEPFSEACVVLFYNKGTGVRFATAEMEELFFTVFDHVDPNNFERNKKNQEFAFNTVSTLLHMSREDAREQLKHNDGDVDIIPEKNGPFAVVIIEHLETITPPDCASSSCDSDREALVFLQKLAKSATIHEKKNALVLTATSLKAIGPDLLQTTSGITPLKLELPGAEERLEVIKAARGSEEPRDSDVSDEKLVHLTAGLSRAKVRELVQTAHYEHRPLDTDHVFGTKKNIIEDQSQGMLEIVQPVWPLDVIGGLDNHKKYLQNVAASMTSGDVLACPMGTLLLGCPGTGKTIFAEVLASEIGVPLVKMKNIREMWVGQSERNLDLVLHLIERMAPVVVFMDEIDQQMQARGTTFHGDSGVSSRMAAEQFAFMSDTALRGKVFWIAASNRPDMLDSALMREGRFDDKVPFVPPNAAERAKIFKALLKKMSIAAANMGVELRYDVSEEEFTELGRLACRVITSGGKLREPTGEDNLEEMKPDEEVLDFTGAEIEAILHKAYRNRGHSGAMTADDIARAIGNYFPTRNVEVYKQMTDFALQFSDSLDFVPKRWQHRMQKLRTQSNSVLVETDDRPGNYI